MFQYEKKLQYPVKIKNPNPALARVIISQYGGPDGNRVYCACGEERGKVQFTCTLRA